MPARLGRDDEDAQLGSKILSYDGLASSLIGACATLIETIAILTPAGTFGNLSATFTAYDPAVAANALQSPQLRSQEAFHG